MYMLKNTLPPPPYSPSLIRHRLSWFFIVVGLFGLNKKVSCDGLLGGVKVF